MHHVHTEHSRRSNIMLDGSSSASRTGRRRPLLTDSRARLTPTRIVILAALSVIVVTFHWKTFHELDMFDRINNDIQQLLLPIISAGEGGNRGATTPSSSNETVPFTYKDANSIETALPIWTHLPPTQFTHNVLTIIDALNMTEVSGCRLKYSLIVSSSGSSRNASPTLVQCQPAVSQDSLWCTALKRIFATRTIPYNVSIGFELSDRTYPEDNHACIGSSSLGGKLVMPNMEDIREMNKLSESGYHDNPETYRFQYKVDVPWEERNTTPIFRGTPWYPRGYSGQTCLNPAFQYSNSLFYTYPRFMAVAFSHDNPSLLNAKFSVAHHHLEPCFARNATNGFHVLLPIDSIPREEYFSNHQVTLVLGGIGAAFRLGRHLMTSTAVILHEWGYHEWFTKYMKPFVHYIPVSQDLHNLNETLLWVREHDAEVKAIGENGRAFWKEYLTFTQHENHIYELLYRMSEYNHFLATNETAL